MEGFLIEVEECDFSKVLIRRYAMLECEVLILSGRVGQKAERLCDISETRIECENVFSVVSDRRTRRCFRTTNVEGWIESMKLCFASLRSDDNKEEEEEVTEEKIKKKLNFQHEKKEEERRAPSTPDLRKTLRQSLEEMKSAVIDAATTTSIPRYYPEARSNSKNEVAIVMSDNNNLPSAEQDCQRTDLITLLLRKEEQIKHLQEMGRRQRRQYRASRQKERKEMLGEFLRLKTLHEKREQDLLRENESLTLELENKKSELNACRRDIIRSEASLETLESRVVEMEKAAVLEKKKRKAVKKKKKKKDSSSSSTSSSGKVTTKKENIGVLKPRVNRLRRRAQVKML